MKNWFILKIEYIRHYLESRPLCNKCSTTVLPQSFRSSSRNLLLDFSEDIAAHIFLCHTKNLLVGQQRARHSFIVNWHCHVNNVTFTKLLCLKYIYFYCSHSKVTRFNAQLTYLCLLSKQSWILKNFTMLIFEYSTAYELFWFFFRN